MRLEGGELKGRRARVDQLVHARGTLAWINRAVEREIDPRLSFRALRLRAKAFGRSDRVIVVIRHVDDRCHASRRGAAGRPDEVLLTGLAAAMHLPVNGAGQDKEARAAVVFAGRRGFLAHAMNDAVRYENIAVIDDPIGEDDGSNKDFVRHEFKLSSTWF